MQFFFCNVQKCQGESWLLWKKRSSLFIKKWTANFSKLSHVCITLCFQSDWLWISITASCHLKNKYFFSYKSMSMGLGWSYLPTKATLRSSSARSVNFCVIKWGPWELMHEHLRTIFAWNLKRFLFNSEYNLRRTLVPSFFYVIHAENINLSIQIPLRLLCQGKAWRYWTSLGCNEWL